MTSTLRLAAAIAVLSTVLGAAPAGTGGTAGTIDDVVREDRAAVDVPGVAVAVTHGSSVVHVAGYGNAPDGSPITGHSTMATASVSKSFTALAVLQLAERGALSLDDPVRERLPEFVLDDPRASAVTVRQLLNQTSGLTDRTLPQFTRDQPRTLAGSVAGFRGRALTTDPGSTWAYYNPNYQIAARLVEVTSGQPFDVYLATHVFGPLGMADSRAISTADELPASAHGHVRLLGRAVPVPEPSAFGAGSGGVLSSADDMAAWLVMQSAHGRLADGSWLLRPSSVDVTRTPGPTSGGYGLGWEIGTTPGGATLVSHGGDLFTSTAYQAVLPDTGYGVAVLADTGTAHGDAQAIGRRIVATLEHDRLDPPSDPSRNLDLALVAVSVLAVGTAVAGVRRAPGWARRRGRRSAALTRTAPLALPVGLLVAMAPIVGALYRGRDVTALQAVYLYPSVTIALVLVGASSTAVLVTRAVCVLRRPD